MNYHSIYKSPIGSLMLDAVSDAVVGVRFIDSMGEETDAASLPLILRQAHRELDEYFRGERTMFTVRTEYGAATDFRKNVYDALMTIPYGKTASYKQIAEQIGSPKASRAVGSANHNNRISIIVPCHRVIGANGKLTGYAGGLDKKEWLLAHEKGSSN